MRRLITAAAFLAACGLIGIGIGIRIVGQDRDPFTQRKGKR